MRRGLIYAAVGLVLAATTAQAATGNDKDAQHTGGTAKGAAVGALAGHEVGSGHAARVPRRALLSATMTRQRPRKSKESSKCEALGLGWAPSILSASH